MKNEIIPFVDNVPPSFNFSQFLSLVPNYTEPRYWFIRTDGGRYYETFRENEFIGIGWNQITRAELLSNTGSGVSIKAKIAEIEQIDITLKKGKGHVSSILGKLLRFQNLKRHDVIIIPSPNSFKLSFGTIMDDEIYNDGTNSDGCEFIKRRKVKWLKERELTDLDNAFYKIITSRHALSDVTKYSKFIDKATNILYFKNGNGHLVFDFKTKDDVNLKLLLETFEEILKIANTINETFGFEEDINDCSIKINLQSPGPAELILKEGKTLALLALLLLPSCEGLQTEDQQRVNQVRTECNESLNKINTNFATFELDSFN